jgi:holliday junction DNA helicase RuvA
MIANITGTLVSVEDSAAYIAPGQGLTYEVLVSAYTAARLGPSIGQSVTLVTVHYIEGQIGGSTMTPRLAGFLNAQDRDFFELFTTCKGIGNRKALRAMAIASDQMAAAIADRDTHTLQSLPEIGKRTAETIIATLHGKVDAFLAPASTSPGTSSASAAAQSGTDASPAPTGARAMSREAMEVLLQLGENRTQAATWIDQALRQGAPPKDVQDLVARVFRIKAGA